MVSVASYIVFCRFFLRNRVQHVVLPEGVSFYGFVTSGIPHGSVLSPLLFLLDINDVVDLFTDGSCIKLYADDVKLYFDIENDSDVVTLQRYGVLINLLNGHRHGSYHYPLKSVVICALAYLHAKIQLTIILMMLF